MRGDCRLCRNAAVDFQFTLTEEKMKILIGFMMFFVVLNNISAVHLFYQGKDMAEKPDGESRYRAKIFFASAGVKMIEAITLVVAIKQLR